MSALTASPVPRHTELTSFRLWVPTTLLFLLLAPFPILLLPLLYLAPRRWSADPAALVFGIGGLLLSLGGTDIDIDAPGARIRLHLF